MDLVVKFLVSATLVIVVSEISKRNTFLGSLLAALPLVSVLAMIFLFRDTRDTEKVATVSMNLFWMVIPSLSMFVVLPVLLRRGVAFYPALGLSLLALLICLRAMLFVLDKFGVKL